MNEILNGKDLAEKVIRNSIGAAIKRLFKLDTVEYSWVDFYLRDKLLREKINGLRQKIKDAQAQPVHRDELKKAFESAMAGIKDERLAWLRDLLKTAQNRQGAMLNSHKLRRGDYIPELGLSKEDIDKLFIELPTGVKQTDIDKEITRHREEIKVLEKRIADELSPSSRFIYNDDGTIIPYPHGCRWTQFVDAWKIVSSHFKEPVDVEGTAITREAEMTAYNALGLGKK